MAVKNSIVGELSPLRSYASGAVFLFTALLFSVFSAHAAMVAITASVTTLVRVNDIVYAGGIENMDGILGWSFGARI